jgi:hypothetical protein
MTDTTLQFKLFDFQKRSHPGGAPVKSFRPPLPACKQHLVSRYKNLVYIWYVMEKCRVTSTVIHTRQFYQNTTREEYVHYCVNLGLEIRSNKT